MKYMKEERLDIGRRIYDGEISRYWHRQPDEEPDALCPLEIVARLAGSPGSIKTCPSNQRLLRSPGCQDTE